MPYEEIVITARPDGSAELTSGWPFKTLLAPEFLEHPPAGVSILPDPEDANRLSIRIGDDQAVYLKVGLALGGHLALEWLPRG